MSVWDKITRLAHLELKEEEKKLIFPQIQKVIEYFHHIEKVPTDNISPLISPLDQALVTRNDEVQSSPASPQDLLRQAPSMDGNFVKTPRVIPSDE